MSVTVVVDASWRLSRAEFYTPYDAAGTVRGSGEVLLKEPAEPSPDAKVLGTPRGDAEGGAKTYGAMSSAPVNRMIDSVLDDSITVGGQTITFGDVLEELKLFFEKWRIEDQENPPTPMIFSPPAEQPTPLPPLPITEAPKTI